MALTVLVLFLETLPLLVAAAEALKVVAALEITVVLVVAVLIKAQEVLELRAKAIMVVFLLMRGLVITRVAVEVVQVQSERMDTVPTCRIAEVMEAWAFAQPYLVQKSFMLAAAAAQLGFTALRLVLVAQVVAEMPQMMEAQPHNLVYTIQAVVVVLAMGQALPMARLAVQAS